MTARALKVAQSLAGAEFGGAENFYTRLVSALTGETAITQHAFTRGNAYRVPRLKAAGVPVTTLRFSSRLDVLDQWHYRRALKAFSPDVVLTYMNRASRLTPRGDYTLACRLGHYYNLKYYRHADYWIGISKGICRHLIEGGMPEQRVYHIPNFAEETEVEAMERDSFDTPADVPILLAAGRLHVNKGFDVLIRALAQVPDAVLWLAGDGPERSALERLAQDSGVDRRIRFLGWRHDIAALMRAADLFVCPSRHEGLGSIVMEAWFNRCPIIATDSQGPGELIDSEATGLLTPVDAVAPLAQAIQRLIEQPALAQQLASRAFDHYQGNYSQRVITDRYVEFFQHVATTHRHSTASR